GASVNGSLAVPATAGTNNNAAEATVSFSGTATADTLSSPYPDYNTDTIYVGANDGKLHKFTPVFNAAPAEITATWPVTVTAGSALTSPVLDVFTGKIFVGDSAGVLKSVSTAGVLAAVTTANSTNGVAFNDGPLLDSTHQTVFAFSPADSTVGSGQVTQWPETLASQVVAHLTNSKNGT